MTQNEKDILLKDLCSRLPYGVKGEKYTIRMDGEFVPLIDVEIIIAEDIITLNGCPGYTIKPYLFPLSSMTEEQKDIFGKLWWNTHGLNMAMHAIDYLNKNHFDYRGLIEKSLALDATNLGIYE